MPYSLLIYRYIECVYEWGLTTAISRTSSSRCCSKTVGDDVRLSKAIFPGFREKKKVVY